MQLIHSLSLLHCYSFIYFDLGVSDISKFLGKLLILLLLDSVFVLELIENGVGMFLHKHFKICSLIGIVEVKADPSPPSAAI